MNLELVANEHCGCGENPLWDEKRGLLFWCDISPGKIWAFDPKTDSHRLVVDLKRECGAFTIEESGDLLLLFTGDATLLNVESGEVKSLKNGFLSDCERFNDCIACPNGSVFAGTVDWSQKTRGGLFHLHQGFENHRITGDSACSNGLAWTPDFTGLYWVDSTSRITWKFDFNRETGELSNQTQWLHTLENTPDGMTTDENGDVWIAFFDGPFVRHYDQNAKLIEQIDFPAKHVTSCIFGGENLDELYVTTGGGRADDAPENPSGALFRLKMGVRGMKEFRSKMG